MDTPKIGRSEFGDDHDNAADDERQEGSVAVLDPSNRELLAEEDARREDNHGRKGKIEGIGFEAERLPSVADEGEDRQREGDDLVEEEDESEGARPIVEEGIQALGTGIPLGDMIGDSAEEKESETVRDEEGQQSSQAELDRELYGEKESQSPDPGEGDGVSPEEGVQEAEPCGVTGRMSHGN